MYEILTAPLIGTVAYASVFPGFRQKSLLQLQKEAHLRYFTHLGQGVRVAPMVGFAIGLQNQMQRFFEKKQSNEVTFQAKVLSSVAVGAISSPFLAISNAQTAGQSLKEALRGLRPKHFAAVTAQESAFVFGLTASELFKKYFGESRPAEFAATYLSAASVSILGNPANAALTRWQAGLSVQGRHLLLGSATRAHWTGVFSLVFNYLK